MESSRYRNIASKALLPDGLARSFGPARPPTVICNSIKKRHHHTQQDWEEQEQTIIRLYVQENLGVAQVVKALKDRYGFETGARKLKSILQGWGVNKQMKSSEWVALSGAIEKRKHEGKETEVLLNGVPIDAKKLKRELHRYSTCSYVAAVQETRAQAVTPLFSAKIIHSTKGLSPFVSGETFNDKSRCLDQEEEEAMSPLNIDDVDDLDREFWTERLNFHTILMFLHEQGKSTSEHLSRHGLVTVCSVLSDCCAGTSYPGLGKALTSAFASPSTAPPILSHVSHPWSVDGLIILGRKIQKCEGGHAFLRVWHSVAHVERADTFQLLDLVLCALVSVNNPMELSMPTLEPIFNSIICWFSDPEHVGLLSSIVVSTFAFLRTFVQRWIEVAIYAASSTEDTSIKDNIYARIEYVLSSDSVSQVTPEDPEALFSVAAKSGQINICRLLVLKGPKLDHATVFPDPVEEAILECRPDILQFLQEEAGFDMKGEPRDTHSPTGCIQSYLASALLKWSERQEMGFTEGPGHACVQQYPINNFRKIIQILLNNGNDPSRVCFQEFNAWEMCILMDAPFLDQLGYTDSAESSIIRLTKAPRSGLKQLQTVVENADITPTVLEVTLFGAIAMGSASLVETFLKAGINPDCLIARHTVGTGFLHRTFRAISFATRRAISYPTRYPILNCLLEFSVSLTGDVIDTLKFLGSSYSRTSLIVSLCRPDLLKSHGSRLLRLALRWSSSEFMGTLFDKGLGPNDTFASDFWPKVTEKDTILQFALGRGTIQIVQFLWEKGSRFEPGHNGGLELFRACASPIELDHFAKVQFLLDKGAQPNSVFGGLTPLMLAASTSGAYTTSLGSAATQSVRLLLQAGADPNLHVRRDWHQEHKLSPHNKSVKDFRKWPLGGACLHNSLPVILLLLKHGAEVGSSRVLIKPFYDGVWCNKDTAEIIDVLIKACKREALDVRASATEALGLVASLGFVNVAIKLIEAGADVNGLVQPLTCVNKSHGDECDSCAKVMPVEIAVSCKWPDMVQLLVNAGAREPDGYSPIQRDFEWTS